MTLPPGMPERGSFGDRFAQIERRLSALERGAPGALSGDGTSTFLRSGDFRVLGGNIEVSETGKVKIVSAAGDVFADFDKDGVDILEADGSVIVRLDGTGLRLNDGAGTKLIDLTTSGLKAYEADGSTMMVLDGSKLRFNRSDGSRQLEITPAGGMKFYKADGSTVITTLDGSGLTVGNAPVVIDASGLDIGSGLTVIDASGVQVGTDVVINSSGLEVIGGMVTPIWVDRAHDGLFNASLNTSFSSVGASITINPPAWVDRMYIQASIYSTMSNNSGSNQNLEARLNGDSTFANVAYTVANGQTQVGSRMESVETTSDPYTISVEARVTIGSNSSNAFAVDALAVGVRDG